MDDSTKGPELSSPDGSVAKVYGGNTNPPHTLGHIDCPGCIELRKMYLCSLSASMPFEEAASIYMRMRKVDATPGAIRAARYIKENTIDSYEEYVASLTLFFGGMPLNGIGLENLFAYQAARFYGREPFIRYRRPHDAKERIVNGMVVPPKGKTSCPAHPDKIKQELNFLIRLLRRTGVWTPQMEEFYEHIQGAEREIRRALTPEEHYKWIEIARSQERWNLIFWYCLIAFDTACSPNELRGLRIGDVNLHHQTISIAWATSKNPHRHRSISIEDGDCLWALEQLLLRAKELGCSSATHYLFPFKYKGKRPGGQNAYDPTRPMTVTGLKSRWDEVRKATGILWFSPADTRHTGATRMAERGIHSGIIMERMGHSNPKMQEHYTHISASVQRGWLRNPEKQFWQGQQPQAGWWPSQQQPPEKKQPRVIPFCGHKIVVN